METIAMLMMRQPELSTIEWRAVAIALRDADQARPRGGTLARFARAITGSAPQRPLADDRLEAIRAFVCETRRSGSAPERLAIALEAQGLSPVQISAMALLAR